MTHSAPPVMGRGRAVNREGLGWGIWLGWGVAGLLALWVLWRNEPAGQVYYPRCYLNMATGLQCPGCGVLRATHALLNGRWQEAWRLNPMWVLMVPMVGWGVVAGLLRTVGVAAWQPWTRPWVVGVVLGLMVAYGIARNLRFFGM